jgi:hypothetical protein
MREKLSHRSVSVLSGLWAGQQRNKGLIPVGIRDFSVLCSA